MYSSGKQANAAVPPMVSAAAHESRRRRQAGVSARHREAERHRRSGCADAQCADRVRRSERGCRARRCSRKSAFAAGAAGRQGLGGQESARAEHRGRSIRRRCGRSASSEAMSPASASCWPNGPPEIVMAGAELNEALPFPGSSLEAHRGVGAESSRRRRLSRVQADAVRRALAGAGRRALRRQPRRQLFRLVGTRHHHVLDNGRPDSLRRRSASIITWSSEPDQKERVLETYVKLVTTQPPPPPTRGRGVGAAATTAAATAQLPQQQPQQPPTRGRGAAGAAPLLLLGAAAA